jgi:hypothetical protein
MEALEHATHPQPVTATELIVDHRNINRLALGYRHGVLRGRDRSHDLEIRFVVEQLMEAGADRGMVIDDQQASSHAAGITWMGGSCRVPCG